MYVGCTIAFDYVDWMWHLLSMDCFVLVDMLKRR